MLEAIPHQKEIMVVQDTMEDKEVQEVAEEQVLSVVMVVLDLQETVEMDLLLA
jgi:hypothetical protein